MKTYTLLIEQLGSTPAQSWRRFLTGMVCFWISAGLTWWLVELADWLFYLAVVAVLISFIVAAWGYVGILANRLLRLQVQREQYKKVFSKPE